MSKFYSFVIRWLFLSINGIKIQFLGVVGFNSSTLSVCCSLKTVSIINFVCPLWTWSAIRICATQIYSPVVDLMAQIMKFYSTFSWCWKIKEKPKIFAKVMWRFWYVQHISLTLNKIHQKKPKWQPLVKLFNVKKNQACYPHQDFEIQLCSTLFNKNVYLCVSFGAVDIVAPKDKEIFKPKILMIITKTFFFWEFSCLED